MTTEESIRDFTRLCHICGAKVRVERGIVHGHRCRIDVDAQMGHVSCSACGITGAPSLFHPADDDGDILCRDITPCVVRFLKADR